MLLSKYMARFYFLNICINIYILGLLIDQNITFETPENEIMAIKVLNYIKL